MAIIKAMSCIMLGTSIETVAPSKSLSVSGIVTGEITEDVRIMVSASGPLPPNILIHIKAVTATGTLYSSTMPQARLGLEPKNSEPMAYAAMGMSTAETINAKIKCRGRRNTSATW